jgi:hypothetical protein
VVVLRRVGLLVAAALVASVSAGAAAPSAVAPPPGAQISASLEYVGRVPASARIVEGKFDTVGGREILITTGRYGFRTYDVSDPTAPQLLDAFQPAEILGANGYWQDEDMDLDLRRKLIIGALDPRHDDVDQTCCAGRGTAGAKTRNPGCRSGFYVISYADPEHLRQVGDFVELPAGHTTSCIEGCNYVWTGGPARRTDLNYLGPHTPGGRGDGRPIWVTNLKDPEHPETFPKPIDLGRNDGITDYSHDVDEDAAGIAGSAAAAACAATPRAAAGATPATTRCTSRSRGTRSSSRAAGSRAAPTGSPSRRRTSSTTRRGRSAGACTRPGWRTATSS